MLTHKNYVLHLVSLLLRGFPATQGLLNVLIEQNPTIGDIMSNRYFKVIHQNPSKSPNLLRWFSHMNKNLHTFCGIPPSGTSAEDANVSARVGQLLRDRPAQTVDLHLRQPHLAPWGLGHPTRLCGDTIEAWQLDNSPFFWVIYRRFQ